MFLFLYLILIFDFEGRIGWRDALFHVVNLRFSSSQSQFPTCVTVVILQHLCNPKFM